MSRHNGESRPRLPPVPFLATVTATLAAEEGHLYSLLKPLFKAGFKRSSHTHVSEQLLRSNVPPSDSERAAVCDVVAIVEEEIVQLQQKLTFSHRRRHRLCALKKRLRVHNAVLSPIRWVPPEVLEQIFQHCTWQFIPDQNCHWRELPWAISQVCRSWRHITLNLPCLWNHIPICLEDDTWANLEAQASFFKRILTRSRHQPLYLYVQAPFKEYDWHPLVNELIPHSERVEELTIESSTITMEAFRKFKGRLPSLRKLTLSKTSRRTYGSALTVDSFQTAPLLREVTLIGLYTHELILPWPQLISFNGSNINRTGLGQVVANSLDLERLEVAGYSYGAGPKTATLPRLTNLKVKLENPHITSNFFFGSLNLPKVEVIEVEEYQGDVLPHLMPMLSRCSTPSMLRKLSLRNVLPDAPGDLTSLLKLTPQLLELHIELPPIYDLCELIIGPNSPPLVPLLETLIIYASSAEDVWRKEIPATTLARSRCETDQGSRSLLKTFRLIFPNPTLCHAAQAELNGWLEDDPTKPKSADQIRLLKLWRQVLHEELPELDYKPFPRKRKFDLKFSQRLDRLLSAIENFHLDDIKGLYVRKKRYTPCSFYFFYFCSFFWD